MSVAKVIVNPSADHGSDQILMIITPFPDVMQAKSKKTIINPMPQE
jgi:hypothetical protein